MSRPDPGGNFASDDHRRVMSALANPDEPHMDMEALMVRVDADDQVDLDEDAVTEILADLEADGDATKTKKGWKNTKAGWDALTGLPVEEGGRQHESEEGA